MIRSGMVHFHTSLEPLMEDINSVTQHPDNYNNGDVEKIARSIELHGMYRPIYVQKSTGYIIAGNHTWEACKSLGAQKIPVAYVDVDDDTAVRLMIDDNELARLAQPDKSQLLALLERLHADSYLPVAVEERDLDVLRKLAEIPLEYDEFAQWPTISIRVPPHIRRAFYTMTEAASGDDRTRFELLLRLAGWTGKS